jgi:protein-S-isoprenylcysteine O-methyltransferase Ste14
MSFAAAGRVAFKRRGLLLPIAVLLLAIPSPRLWPDPVEIGLLGLAVALIGQAVRIATIGLAYIIRGGRDHQVYAEDLVTGGIYSHCRNPMYLGNALLLAGLALASNSWLFVLAGVPIAALWHVAIIATEESFLRQKFGRRYEAYCAAVPRLVPRLGGLAATFRRHEFDWRRVLFSEYGKPFDWLLAIALATIVNSVRDGVFAPDRPAIILLEFIILARLGLWLLVRTLAKAGEGSPNAAPAGGRLVDETGAVVLLAILLLPLSTPPHAVFGSAHLEHLKDLFAEAAVAGGLLMRIAALARSPLSGSASAAPLRFGNLLTVAGIVLMHGDLVVIALGMAVAVGVHVAMPAPAIAAPAADGNRRLGYGAAVRQDLALIAAVVLSLVVIELDEEVWITLFPAPLSDLVAFAILMIACAPVAAMRTHDLAARGKASARPH